MKNPTEELTGIYSSLKSWDISLALNMTYYYFHVILNEVKNPTEKLTGIDSSLKSWDISLALNMTYFYPLSSALPTLPPKEEARFVFASGAKQSPGRVEVYGVYSPYFFRGIAAALRASQ